MSPGWFYVFHFFSFFSFPSGGLGGKVMRDLAGPSATYGGFDLPTEPPCCYTRLKRRSGNALFSILFVASALAAAAAHASFMPEKRVGAKKRRGRRRRWMKKEGKKTLAYETNLRYWHIF